MILQELKYIGLLNKTQKHGALLLLLFCTSLFNVPEASADDCPSTFSTVGGERVQLVACDSDESNSNADTAANFQFGGGVTVNAGDLMLVTVAIDTNGQTLTPQQAGWTEIPAGSGTISGRGLTSNIWFKIADVADEAKPNYQFSWSGGEKNQGYMLLFTGASGTFNIASNDEGNSTTPNSPSVDPNSPFNLILRLLYADRNGIANGVGGPDLADHTNIIQRANTGGNTGTRVGVAAAFTHQAADTPTPAPDFTIAVNEGTHKRTISVEPYEFRFFLEDTSGAGPTQSSVCSVKQVTLRVTDSAGNVVPSFTGTVTLSTSTGNGNWSKTGTATDAEGTLTDTPGDDDGVATYQFVANDLGEMILNYENTNIEVVNFDVTFGNWSESTTAGYTSPNLTITSCIPSITASACVANNTTNNANLTIGGLSANPLNRGRMVVMAIGLEGSAFTSAATFDGAPMTLIYREANPNGAGNVTELWGILDADLPTAPGSYNGSFTNADGGPTMCMVYLEGVQQEFPGPSSGATAADPINGSQDEGVQDAVTSITTAADNAIIFSVVGNGSGGADYPPATSVPALTWSNLFNAPDPDGGAEFDANFAVKSTAGALTVTETYPGGTTLRHTHVVSSFRPLQQIVTPTEIRLSHSTESDVCSIEEITISITDGSGNVAEDYTGTITITNSAGAGTWTISDADNPGSLVDNGGGSVDYTFVDSDDGEIVLNFALGSANAALDFDVTAAGLASPSGANDPALEIANCKAVIDVDPGNNPNIFNVCSASVTTRLTILNRDDGVPNGTIGVVTLRATPTPAAPTIGDFVSVTNSGTDTGTLNNGATGDGIATYTFDPAEDNIVDIEFNTDESGDLNIEGFSTYIDFQSGPSDQLLTVYDCEFRISISGDTDVCSIAQVTIDVFNSNGDDINDYVGTVNLSQNSGTGGTWSDPGDGAGQPQGTLTETVLENAGAATYEFVLADGGQVTLDYTNQTNETVNFEVSDGTSTASNAAFDPDMLVSLCTFRISLGSGSTTACSFEDVTISVFDSLSGPASNYSGTVTLSTDSLIGSWSGTGTPADAQGTLDNSLGGSTNNGQASYEFVTGDGGDATLRFTHDSPGTVNFDLVDGVIVEDGGFDPNLEVTGCIPGIAEFACFSGASGGTGSIDVGPSDPGRMIVMVVFHSDQSPMVDVTGATLGGQLMTPIRQEKGVNTSVEMFGILNAAMEGVLPDNTPAAGAYTESPAAPNGASMCLVRLTDVEQAFPAPDGGTPTQGQVNSNSFEPDGAPNEMSTSITTNANNALILSAGVSDFTQAPDSWFNDVDPDPPMQQLFFNNNDQNPVGGTAGGSSGNKAVAGLINVIDTDTQDADASASHIVASFNPRVAGAPQATGFEPVVLFETLSGNQEYRAIGNTMRSSSNSGAGGSCSFTPSAAATSSSATLDLPPGSTIVRAYVYWAGSGEEADADDEVDFGVTGSLSLITADDVFYIENVGGGSSVSYFAGYKNVTTEVASSYGPGATSYTLGDLEVQADAPWNASQACAGGWSLIVVYNNPQERFRVTNLFHGFQPYQNSAFTLVPRNFRMATTDAVEILPNGQVTHVTLEGDETLDTGDESLGIQVAPGLETFTTLSNSFNPTQADFNSTISRPIHAIGGTGFYEFQSGAGVNGDGYEEDTGPGVDDPRELGSAWGFDVDTHYIAGDTSAGVLWNFAQPGAEAEEITTRYSSGQDLVMLISEVISVTNFDLADLEIFKGQSGAFKVNTTAGGSYTFTVTNNGNGGITGGQASGRVLVADVLPPGITINSVSGTAWSCNVSVGNDAFTCEFDIGTDCDIANSCGTTDNELLGGESLPVLTATVDIGDTSFFPLLSNNVKNVGRMQHNGGNCTPLPSTTPGQIPDPESCDRSPQFDNVNDLQGGSIDINDVDDKTTANNNVDSLITDVRGVETDLGITKVVDGILEEGGTGTYTLTVTNFGPDATTGGAGGTITVTDVQPPGVTFTSVSGTGWNCPGSAFPCTYAGALGSGSSAVLTLDVNVTGAAGANVTNTAAVSSGTFNFDANGTNDSATDVTAIVAPPVSSNEKFLLSVSVPSNTTEIGGLTAPNDIKNEDLFLYNPLTDVATEFYVNDDAAPTYDINDANAVHLFKNGFVALSSETGGTIGATPITFQAEDIVVWDPIQDSATVLFDGTTLFDGPITADDNIDAVYVRENGNILFSTAGPASISTGGPTLNFQPGDIVEYDPSDGSTSIVFDASASNLFNAEVQVDGLYVRVDPSDPDANENIFILSVNETSVNVGSCAGCDPVGGTFLGRDDIVEVDLTGADPVTQNLFVGDIPFGVFAPTDADREIDAIHVVEDAYIGYFAISQSQAGSTCEAGQITISKRKGLSFDNDEDYTGSIRISTDLNIGDWSVSVGNGTLDNGTAGDGAATYTFVPADNGEVTLFLAIDTVSTVNVDVTNNLAGFVGESGSEDPNFVFNNVITAVTYRDEFANESYGNNNGTTLWTGDWLEGGGESDGAGAGNILVNGGELEITASGGIPNPTLKRIANLSLFTVTNTVFLNFDYKHQSINGGSDVLEVQVSTDDSNWTTVREYGAGGVAIAGTNLTPQSESIDVTAALGIVPPITGPATAYVRFLVSAGYAGASKMFFDNVEFSTQTTDCGIGTIDHYEIRIDNITGPSTTIVPGIQCAGSVVTITGHDVSDFPSAANETITLGTSTGKGDWTLLSGGGTLNNGALGDGIATYQFAPGESAVSFIFNYTAPIAEDEQVNINVSASHPVLATEDPTLQVDLAGLLFYNETDSNPVNLSPIPTQIAGKPSNVLPDIRSITIEAVRTSDNDPLACTPLFDAGNSPTIGFAAECIDPQGCSPSLTDQFVINGQAMTPAPDDTDADTTTASFVDLVVPMLDQGGGRVGGELVFNYADVGSIQIHAQFEIPLGDNLAGTLSGDSISGVSNVFVVRPFGYDLDFSDDRSSNGVSGDSYATDQNGSKFRIAGAPFDATVTAIAWQSADDSDFDGIPDQGADLFDNPITPNYGNESTAADYDVLVSLNQVVLPDPGVGALSNGLFANVSNGSQIQSMQFDEVGIIDLDITLVDSSDGTTPVSFMGTGPVIRGNAKNVGRFYPQDFEIYGSPMIIPRPIADSQPLAIGTSTFTYMGEDFGLSVPVRARNANGDVTRNYVGDFAKLGQGLNDLSADKFRAIEVQPGVDNDLSARIALGDSPLSADPSISWNSDPNTNGGLGLISGNLVFERQVSGVEDGPYDTLTIAINTQDSDDVPFLLDLDTDDAGGNDAAIIDEADFRYGRLLIDEAFGSELDPVGITFRLEYWDGTDFVTNVDDSSTTIRYDASEDVEDNRSLRWVDGTFQENLIEDGNDTPDAGESFFELDAILADTDVTRSIFEGQTIFRSGDDDDGDGVQDDSPIFASPPGEGFEGNAIVEFNLNDASLPFSLDFLSYDWRGGVGEVDAYDEIPDGTNYNDNPRSVVNFGTYRGHDRIINWQEIYIGPSD